MCNMVKPKFGLTLSVQVFASFTVAAISKRKGKDRLLLCINFSYFQPIFAKLNHGNLESALRWLAPSPLESYKRNELT